MEITTYAEGEMGSTNASVMS